MTVDRLFTSRHLASFKMGFIASPFSWSWFNVCCRDMFQKDLSTAAESVVTLPTLREIMYFTKTKRNYFRFAPPAPYPRKSPTGPLQSIPQHRAQMAGLVPVVARGIVTGLTNCTVHQWQFSSIRSSFCLASSRCVCFFRFLLKVSILRKFTTTGAGYGLFSYP